MKSLFHLFTFDDTYGPGTDLAMALLGIFILSTAITKKNDVTRNNRLKTIAENQIMLINELAKSYKTKAVYQITAEDSLYLISTDQGDKNTIAVRNSEISQLFTFGESLLFKIGEARLKPEGVKVISDIGQIIKNNSQLIEEMQIQGHADTTIPDISDFYKSNIELASARATTVFSFFKENSGIDPSEILMSIVSYGEFKPVQRRKSQTAWNRKSLNNANNTQEERSRNRRIEIVVIYK